MEYLTLLAGLLSGAFAVVAGGYIGHFLTHDRWWREKRLHELENLYVSLTRHLAAIDEYYTRSSALLKKAEEIELETANKMGEDLKTYLRAMQEDEKQATAIPMIIGIYFKQFAPIWEEFRAAMERLNEMHAHTSRIALNKEAWEALTKEERIARHKVVWVAVSSVILPELRGIVDNLCKEIVKAADEIKAERPWPLGWMAQMWGQIHRQLINRPVMAREPTKCVYCRDGIEMSVDHRCQSQWGYDIYAAVARTVRLCCFAHALGVMSLTCQLVMKGSRLFVAFRSHIGDMFQCFFRAANFDVRILRRPQTHRDTTNSSMARNELLNTIRIRIIASDNLRKPSMLYPPPTHW